MIFIDGVALAKQGDNRIGSVHPSVSQRSHGRVQQRAKKSHYQFKVFVSVSNNRTDAVDRLLIDEMH